MKNKKVILWIIFGFAAFLRIYFLHNIPPHPSLDEVSIGYNAYSILRTGMDEFGNSHPILLRAYDDYRPAHYTYLVVPFVKLFGLNVIAVRLPSVLLSIASIISVYFLIKLMFRKFKRVDLLSLATVGMLSISPWHIYISRLGHEVNLFFSLFIFAMTFFYLYLEKKKWFYLVVSSVMFALSFSSYQSGKIFIPIIVVVLMVLYSKELLRAKFLFLVGTVIFLVVSSPIIITSVKPQAMIRFQATNIFTLADPYLKSSAQKILEAKEKNDIFSQIINNRRFVYLTLPITAYASHFNPIWLFSNGGEEPFKVPNLGLLYLYEFPLILIGIVYLLRNRNFDKKSAIVVLAWLVASILPAAITTGFPHAMRSFQVIPIPQLFSALGILYLVTKVRRLKLLAFGAVLLVVFSTLTLLRAYFFEFPKKTAYQFQYGVTEAMQYAIKNAERYEKIYVSNQGNLFQSYMFYLFVSKMDPENYIRLGGTGSGGYAEEHTIGKFSFGDINNIDESNVLILSNPSEVEFGKKIKTIYYPDGRESIWIMEK